MTFGVKNARNEVGGHFLPLTKYRSFNFIPLYIYKVQQSKDLLSTNITLQQNHLVSFVYHLDKKVFQYSRTNLVTIIHLSIFSFTQRQSIYYSIKRIRGSVGFDTLGKLTPAHRAGAPNACGQWVCP